MKKFTILAALFCLRCITFAQTGDEENIKKLIESQAEAFKTRNLEAWKAAWVQDAKSSSTFISRNGYNTVMGWDSLKAGMERNFQNPLPAGSQIKTENVTIRANGNMAWVDFDAIITPATDQSSIFPYEGATRNHNHQLLVKENDQWKIATRIVTVPETYKGSPDHVAEAELNNAGYELINAKKMNEAIEVFKLNVKLYPGSWNTYDSLGEAYALAGNKKMAIENYEKSMKLNPKSESGPPALTKLKQK